MSTVDRTGRKPRCSAGSIPQASQERQEATIFNNTLTAWATSEIPLSYCTIRAILSVVKNLDGRILPLLGDFSRSPNIAKYVVEAPGELGVVELQSFDGKGVRSSTACQFDIPRITIAILAIACSFPSDSESGRGGSRSKMVGQPTFGECLFKGIW